MNVLLKDVIDIWDIYFIFNQGLIIIRIAHLSNVMGSCHLLSLMLLGKLILWICMQLLASQ